MSLDSLASENIIIELHHYSHRKGSLMAGCGLGSSSIVPHDPKTQTNPGDKTKLYI